LLAGYKQLKNSLYFKFKLYKQICYRYYRSINKYTNWFFVKIILILTFSLSARPCWVFVANELNFIHWKLNSFVILSSFFCTMNICWIFVAKDWMRNGKLGSIRLIKCIRHQFNHVCLSWCLIQKLSLH
jgi:hypothetical protein